MIVVGVEKPVVVVTGGSGLLGSALIARLRSEYHVVNFDLKGDPFSPADVEFICVDLTSEDSVRRAVDRVGSVYGRRVASLVHLAAFYDFSGEPSPLYDKVTVEGTARLLEAAKALELEQFVFSSTMLVHRPTLPGDRIDEDDQLEATWAYPESKVQTERVIREHHAEIPAVVLRLAGVYDEDGDSPPLTNQVQRIHGRWVTSHFYPASLQRGQAFVHRDDAIDAIVRCVTRRNDLPRSFLPLLIGEPLTLGYGEVQQVIAAALFGRRWWTLRIPKPVAQLGAWLRERNPLMADPFVRSWMVDRADDHYELDISRASDLLGWEPQHSLRAALPEMVQRLRADPDGWYAHNQLEPPRKDHEHRG